MIGSISFKLRALFVVGALASLASVLHERKAFLEISDRMASLSGQSIPLVENLQVILEVAPMLRATTLEILETADAEALGATADTLAGILNRARQQGIFVRSVGPDTPFAMTPFESLLDLQGDWIERRQELQQILDTEGERLKSMLRSLQPAQTERMLQFARAASLPDASAELRSRGNQIIELLDVSRQLSALSLLTQSLGGSRLQGALALKPQIIQELLAVSLSLGRLEQGELRARFAQQLAQFDAALIGQDGAFAILAELQRIERARQSAAAEARQFVEAMNVWADSTALATMQSFDAAAETTKAQVAQIFSTDLYVTIALWVGFMTLLWSLLERNVIRRLSRLTAHIRDMSAGDLARPVKITGGDEVTLVERAVENSRLTTQDLANKNDELQRFAYVAAHDLRAPLRAITNLVEWTREDFADALPTEAKENLDLIDSRAERLSNHLSALLDYARAGQTDNQLGIVDLPAFCVELRELFAAKNGFTIRQIGSIPPLETYAAPFKTILINLVSNAIKHHDRGEGAITITAEAQADRVLIQVADDGPGIATRYHDRIFVLFQTLKSRDDVEGSGLGLALVQKLAGSLGGTITVHSDPDIARGAVFTLCVPIGSRLRPVSAPQFEIAA